MIFCKKKKDPIYIFRGDDTDAFDVRTIRFVVTSALDMDGATAEFTLLNYSKTFTTEELKSGELVVSLTSDETKSFPIGPANGTLRFYDNRGRVMTVQNKIEFFIGSIAPYEDVKDAKITVDVTDVPAVKFDEEPTEGSRNAARSGGIFSWTHALLQALADFTQEAIGTVASDVSTVKQNLADLAGKESLLEGDFDAHVANKANPHETSWDNLSSKPDIYDKEEVDDLISQTISAAVEFKGSVATKSALPTNPRNGDMWIVNDTKNVYIWSQSQNEWQEISHVQIDTSDFVQYDKNESGDKVGVTLEGYVSEGENSTASGSFSHAEGEATIAKGDCAHAEGDHTTASGSSSHAEGAYTTASGAFSHAEGEGAIASGEDAHAEGVETYAKGYASHAEGEGAIASGEDAHAEGVETYAKGYASHASGYHACTSETLDDDEEIVHDIAWVWNGNDVAYRSTNYCSHGDGTFNINPVGGADGFYIGDKKLSELIPKIDLSGMVTQVNGVTPDEDGWVFLDVLQSQADGIPELYVTADGTDRAGIKAGLADTGKYATVWIPWDNDELRQIPDITLMTKKLVEEATSGLATKAELQSAVGDIETLLKEVRG